MAGDISYVPEVCAVVSGILMYVTEVCEVVFGVVVGVAGSYLGDVRPN